VGDVLPLRAPRALEAGSRVIAVAASSPFDGAAFEQGLALLRERYRVEHRTDLTARAGFLAGDDERRLAELQAAINDDGVAAIMAARGGYGATRLLDRLDLSALQRHPKLLVGFSDVTALHALWARAGVRSVHGPMIATLGKGPRGPVAADALCAILEGGVPTAMTGLRCDVPGRARGVLLGGNLAVLTALIGTPFLPSFASAILFLEDIGERPYRVDRMLTTWHQAGAFAGVAGVVLGAFTDCDPAADGVRVEAVLHAQLARLGVPVVSGLAAGHIDDNHPLPFGAVVEIDATGDAAGPTGGGVITFVGGACETK
jgi:muramoyltetrapeptide carboxypeptidase